MFNELLLTLDWYCSDEEREECLPIIIKIIGFASKARRQGLLSLETDMHAEEDLFLRTGMQLVCDGTYPVIVKRVLQNLTLAENFTGYELLRRLLITEGVLHLQNGANPRHIALIMLSLLGERYLDRADEIVIAANDSYTKILKFNLQIQGLEVVPENREFEEIVLKTLDVVALAQMLNYMQQKLGIRCLVLAMQGYSERLIQKLLMLLPTRNCLEVIERWKPERVATEEECCRVEQCQNRIIAIIQEHLAQGTRSTIDLRFDG